jgi:hypothetical protein
MITILSHISKRTLYILSMIYTISMFSIAHAENYTEQALSHYSSYEKINYIACILFIGLEPQQCTTILKEDPELKNDLDELCNRTHNDLAWGLLGSWLFGTNPYSLEELYNSLMNHIEKIIYEIGIIHLEHKHNMGKNAAEKIISTIIQEVRLTKRRYPTFASCNGLAIFGGRLGSSLRRELSSLTKPQEFTNYQPHEQEIIPTHKPLYTSSDCEICFEPFTAHRQPVLLPCGHQVYCVSCLEDWFFEHKTNCPKCRYHMSKELFKQCINEALKRQKHR